MARNRYYSGPVTDHFDGTLFYGPGTRVDRSLADLWRLYRTPFADWPARVPLPLRAAPLLRVDGAALRVTAIGHASHLIQTRGLNLLVDPVWSDRASPFSFIGPKRVRDPGLALDSLPTIDAILVTHNHYDHLDLPTLSRLDARGKSRIIVPLGNDTIIRRHDDKLHPEAFDWGDRVPLSDDVAVTLVPSYHWSARWHDDRRMALWAAFVIETPDGAIYHIGDTGYQTGAIFREIPRRFGPPRLAILPIGAYEPRWFMAPQHVAPEESVAIFKDCGAHYALAHHWGTFRLTAEPIDEPPRRLAAALAANAIGADRFRALEPGEYFDVPRCCDAQPEPR